MQTVHIERKNRGAIEDASRTLKKSLTGHEGRSLRAAEASTLSGLPLDMAEAALLKLHSVYPSTFEVGDDGGFVFRFTSLSKRREGGGLRRLWLNIRRGVLPRLIAIQHGIEDNLIFLLMPALMLILTANMVGLALPLSLDFPGVGFLRVFPGMFLMLGIGLFGIFSALALLFILLLLGGLMMLLCGAAMIVTAVYLAGWERQFWTAIGVLAFGSFITMWGWGFASTSLESIRSMSSRKEKDAMFRDVWLVLRGFVFGARTDTKVVAGEELRDERQLTALLVQKKGVLAARDLVSLFGWNMPQAEAELSRILLDYGGDIEVTEEGHFVYVFPAWRERVEAQSTEPLVPFWERVPEAPRYWGVQRSTRNLVIVLLIAGLLGLCVSELVFAPDDFFFPTYSNDEAIVAGLGIWPYLVIAAIMGLRGLLWWVRRLRHEREGARLLAVREVLAQAETGGWYVDTKFASDFGGELDELQGTRDGAYFFRFPALQDHGRALRGAAQVVGSASPSS
jgi:hypothetical protein